MAEGKKSFVLYADLISVVEKLIEKDRKDGTNISGELFFHILEYVNDRHPKSDNFIVEMVFEPIRLQLKRDLQRYEQIRAKRAESGKLGGRPQKQDKAKKANGFSEKQTKAKKADTVNVNDNDTVLSKDNNISDFDKVVQEWYQYKKEKGQSYKSQIGKTKFVNKLNELSGGNADIARQIIEQSMANNWAGIFELKNKPISAAQMVGKTIHTEF